MRWCGTGPEVLHYGEIHGPKTRTVADIKVLMTQVGMRWPTFKRNPPEAAPLLITAFKRIPRNGFSPRASWFFRIVLIAPKESRFLDWQAGPPFRLTQLPLDHVYTNV